MMTICLMRDSMRNCATTMMNFGKPGATILFANIKSASVINDCTGVDNFRKEFTLNADDKYKAMTNDLQISFRWAAASN